jgi:hypothetical protein
VIRDATGPRDFAGMPSAGPLFFEADLVVGVDAGVTGRSSVCSLYSSLTVSVRT